MPGAANVGVIVPEIGSSAYCNPEGVDENVVLGPATPEITTGWETESELQ